MGRLIYHGHSCVEIETAGGTRLVIDPFLSDNPRADVGPEHFEDRLDFLLLTHGHGDHIGDTWRLLKATGATLIASFEIVGYAQAVQKVEHVHPMHIGGGWNFPFGRVKLTPAIHGGKIDAEGAEGYTTFPAGILLEIDGTSVLHAGDTALTRDMELLEGRVDVALLPIGDNFTMGPEDAARAVGMIKPKTVIPIHYGTWPYIDVDPEDFRSAVGDMATVKVMEAGESLDL